jgi:transcriptional regulator with XRE-family HTH domain
MPKATAQMIGDAARKARVKAGKSQEDAAQALGVSRVAVSNYERGLLPTDFAREKLPLLAALYNTTPAAITALAESDVAMGSITGAAVNEEEPLERHIQKFPPAVQSWFFAFLSELLALSESGELFAEAIERARSQLTFAQLDLWAGGRLHVADSERCLAALQWCAEASWRSITQPGWLALAKEEWQPLPTIFGRAHHAPAREHDGRSRGKPRR